MEMSCHIPHNPAALPRERIPATFKWKIAWVLEPTWVLLEKRKFLALAGIRNPDLRERIKI
jgi:hypothetical protein